MNLQATIWIYGGGPGSGCHGPDCGRPSLGNQTLPTTSLVPTTAPETPKKWRKYNPNAVAGYFRHGTTIADMYKTLAAKEGEWHPISDFETRHAGKANIGYRVQELKYTGKRSGRWTIERSGDQVRIFLNKKGEERETLSDQNLSLAESTAKKFIELQDKGQTWKSKELFDSYYKEMGVSARARSKMEDAIEHWTGSSNSNGAQRLRSVAMNYYKRNPEDEYTNGYDKVIGTIPNKAKEIEPALMALKAYTAAYAKIKGVNVVYRGVGGDPGQAIKDSLKGADSVALPINSLSSWSTNIQTAKGFGSVAFKMKVDPDNIWAMKAATPWLFDNHSNENEVIVGARLPKEVFHKGDVLVKKSSYEWGNWGD